MPEFKDTKAVSSKGTIEEVELKQGADGTFEPVSKKEEEKAQRVTIREIKKKKPTTSDNEERFVDGFRKGFGVVRKIGEVLKIKI